MRALTEREKRTIRVASVGIGIYLILFGGFQVWKFFQAKRSDYVRLIQEARNLRREILPYQDKVLVVKKLMEGFQMDPAKLSKATVVAEASAAIQKSVMSGGLQMGPMRESPARTANREIASIQIECSGPVPAAMALLHRLESLGFPLIVDSVQITSEPSRPGQIKLNLTLVILDFGQWKSEARSNV